MRIVETSNYGEDYPDEKFVNLPMMPEEQCKQVCKIVNDSTGENCSRYWKVVADDYSLSPAFEP